jgi:hypothetical protein
MVTMRKLLSLVAAFSLTPALLGAQGTPTAPALDFSGVLFGNFHYRTDDASKALTGGQPMSRFDVGRAYLTFRMPAGDRGSIRVTTDIFNQTPSTYYSGWTVRLKYGYFQYDFTKNLAGVQGLGAVGRVGMLHTVIVEHIEGFWPRWIGNSAEEQNGFYASADVGAASLMTFPNRRGEMYFTITNGSNYSSGETDRFKDFAARVSLTPFANDSGFFRTLTFSPFYYRGAAASAFVAPPAAVSDGLRKDRQGLFVGLRDRRVTGGAEFSQRVEEAETAGPPLRAVVDRTGTLKSAFALVRPMELMNPKKRSNFGLLARYDAFELETDIAGLAPADNRFVVAGIFWDVNARITLALDYQELKAQTTTSTTFPTKTLFLHWVANF